VEPPFIEVAVNVATLPAQMVSLVTAIETDGVAGAVTYKVAVEEYTFPQELVAIQ